MSSEAEQGGQIATQYGASPPPGSAVGGVCPRCGAATGGLPFCVYDGALRGDTFCLNERYDVDDCLGAGGMSFVFSGRHRLMGRQVAVKVLQPELARDSEHAQRFLREARTASQLDHEGIVSVLDCGRDDTLGLTYLVMERVWGSNLAEVVARDGPLHPHRALPILVQILDAMGHAHAEGVVHRDLKGRNVMLVQAGGQRERAKLCDFGLSRPLDGRDRITLTGQLLGTPAYMAPEQIRGDELQDHRVDIYAFGVVAFELLSGRLPIEADNPVALLAAKLNQESTPLLERFPHLDVSPEIDAVLRRCLARDPDQRPASGAEVRTVLEGSQSAPQLDALDSSGAGHAGTRGDTELIGEVVGPYRVVEMIGRGDRGEVYLAKHPVLGTKVAIRVLATELDSARGSVERFVAEARAASEIDSPIVPKVYDFGHLADGRVYAVMEFLDGETVAQRVARLGPLGLADTVRIVEGVVEAMHRAHTAGILHCDIRPENIMLVQDPDGREQVKLLDIGVASLLAPRQLSLCPPRDRPCSVQLYCPPEQSEGSTVGPDGDVYALGASLFTMLTGRPPFVGNAQEVQQAKSTQEPPTIRSLRADVPPAIDRSLRRMMARNIDARFSSMRELHQEIAGWREWSGDAQTLITVAESPPPEPAPARPSVPSPHRVLARGRIWVFPVATVVALAAILMWLGLRSPAPRGSTPEVAPAVKATPVVEAAAIEPVTSAGKSPPVAETTVLKPAASVGAAAPSGEVAPGRLAEPPVRSAPAIEAVAVDEAVAVEEVVTAAATATRDDKGSPPEPTALGEGPPPRDQKKMRRRPRRPRSERDKVIIVNPFE